MDKYLNRLRNEQKKRVRFEIVEDNARFHSSVKVDRWASTDRRLSLRRHHSQPILRKRCDKEDKAIARWSSEPSTCVAPPKFPTRMLSSGGERWRVSRNNSDSLIHTPPKRRFTSPNSPMLMFSSLKCNNLLSKATEKDLPSSPPLRAQEAILDHALCDVNTDGEQPRLDDSTNTETDGASWNVDGWNGDENDESVPLVQTKTATQQSQQQQEREPYPTRILKSLLGLLDLTLLWSVWNAISRFICTAILRCNKDDSKRELIPKDSWKVEKMEKGEAIPLAIMHHQPHSSPLSSSWEPCSLSVLHHQ